MKLSLPLRSLLIGVVLVTVACGGSDGSSTSGAGDPRTVEVTMADNRFEPATLTVARGEKVKFTFRNSGTVVHDAYVGDAGAQAQHEADMRGGGGGHDAHGGGDGAAAITVDPGRSGTLTHTFDEAGEIEIGCHEPGHFAGGMKIAVVVS